MIDFKYKNNDKTILDEDIKKYSEFLFDYIDYLKGKSNNLNYDFSESFINLSLDCEGVKKVTDLVLKKKSDKLKYILLIGIGGSNLGTMAIYESLFGSLYTSLEGKYPKILFLDTNDPKYFSDVLDIVSNLKDEDEILVNIISKSGKTTETLVNFEAVYGFLKNKFSNIDKRIVVTTDSESELDKIANNLGLSVLNIPKSVGGRYSVFSAVGLFPLKLLGVDIDRVLAGARQAKEASLQKNLEENIALFSAVLIFLHNKNGKNILNHFFFKPELYKVGAWYRQLVGESLGKAKNLKGEVINSGITPIISLGSVDLHSMVQLFFGGPKDKFTIFVNSKKCAQDIRISESVKLTGLSDPFAGKSFSDVASAIYQGVLKAYDKNKLSYIELNFSEINEESLGFFLQMKMMEMMYIAKLLGVNAFDQPNVEDYKKETEAILKELKF